jgi:hypothetical protein
MFQSPRAGGPVLSAKQFSSLRKSRQRAANSAVEGSKICFEIFQADESLAFSMPEPSLHDLLLSHSKLRAALIVAGKQIRKLNFGRKNDPALVVLRRTLRDSRALAREFKSVASPRVGVQQ